MTKPDLKFTLLVPTMNEIIGMKAVMPKIDRKWVDQILVVDGGSTDGTVEYAREQGYDVYEQKTKGLRFAYIEGIHSVKGDIVITFSPDGNSLPERIPALVEKMKEGWEMVIVSRYLDGAKSYDDDPITGFGNWMFRHLINIMFRAKYTDPFVMFRAWRKDLFFRLDLDLEETYSFEERMLHTTIGVEQLFTMRVAKCKLPYSEIPGDEPKRIGGIRKLQVFRWGAASLYEVFAEQIRWPKSRLGVNYAKRQQAASAR
ncbi:MAG: glycosyltransferase family 2 protein [Elusimicrobia bacterium]|nr:glycosyltransferase family 2 protein [Elusimicrobiota bacterium]